MFVVVGLGNPGKEYTNTRHNIGFDTIDLLAERNNIKINKIKFKSVYGEGIIGSEKVLLVKPQTYMNNSGITVRDIYNFYKVPIDNIIVIVDDIDIDFAAVRIKRRGSAGSHNGLKSIIYLLQRDDFPRVKIGIGKKHENQDLANFVLSRFPKEEREIIEISILTGAESVEAIIKHGIEQAMNEFNTKGNRAQD
ncbi:aminoacyl-tRNA hydrolase [Tissierella carlieri]|uniref:Peptidyl-tRNA hydrolase n=1 Tax=Tissierella carlieri TaxID=689904 RepID=A0ABT1SFM3_9FIRM|nr:aminoacyl-tRNA hydrolase [Tissierella carlieri]MCQ4925214.1 aminoacyl-tRNA hydrolase [Tissierella carlieri]MDU5082389.1 aminoacyl-tRNA hydrolase [Bacillota bacterium]